MLSNLLSFIPMMALLEARIFMEDEDQVPPGGCSSCVLQLGQMFETRNNEGFHPDAFMILWIILGLHKQLERRAWVLVTAGNSSCS